MHQVARTLGRVLRRCGSPRVGRAKFLNLCLPLALVCRKLLPRVGLSFPSSYNLPRVGLRFCCLGLESDVVSSVASSL